MVRIPFFTGHANFENSADRVRDHPFLVRMNHTNYDPAGMRGNNSLIRRVLFFFEFDSKESQPIANPGLE